MDVTVTDSPGLHRYDARVDRGLVGYSYYTRSPTTLTVRHTEVFEEHEGRGIGSALVRAVLDDARRRGLVVVPVCRYTARWIDRHREEYGDLLVAG